MDERFAFEGWVAVPFWITGCVGLALFLWGASMNLWGLHKGAFHQASGSLAPVGMFGSIGLILLPVEGSDALVYWPLVLDIGTLAAMIVIPVGMVLYVVHEFWAKARRLFEQVPDERPDAPLQLYGQAIERGSEGESHGQAKG